MGCYAKPWKEASYNSARYVGYHPPTMWGPPVINWFINPSAYIVISVPWLLELVSLTLLSFTGAHFVPLNSSPWSIYKNVHHPYLVKHPARSKALGAKSSKGFLKRNSTMEPWEFLRLGQGGTSSRCDASLISKLLQMLVSRLYKPTETHPPTSLTPFCGSLRY